MLMLLSCNYAVIAQSGFDSLMTRRAPDCRDIAFNCTILFKEYIEKDDKDSAQLLLTYWQSRCSMNELIQRAKILFSLQYRSFNDSILDDNIITYLKYFQDRLNFRINFREQHSDNIFSDYDEFTMATAVKLKSLYDDGTMEYLLSRFYSASVDSFFQEVQKPQYGYSKIYRLYLNEVNQCRDILDLNWACLAGTWVPTGAASNLGIHPEIGIQGGFRKNSITYDLTLAFKFVDTPKPYFARRIHSTGTVDLTTHFFGAYIGFDMGWMVYETRKEEIHLLAGAGWDGFDTFPSDGYNNNSVNNSATASSYNFNFGAGYRYYLNKKTFLGLQIKYNVVDYTLNHVVNFTGNPITIRLLVGGISNMKRDCYERLQYKNK